MRRASADRRMEMRKASFILLLVAALFVVGGSGIAAALKERTGVRRRASKPSRVAAGARAR